MLKPRDSEVIRHDDLVEEGIFTDHFVLEAEAALKSLTELEGGIKKTAKSFSLLAQSSKFESIDDVKKHNDLVKKTNDLALASEKINKAKLQTEKELENVRKAKAQADKAEIEASKKRADSLKKEKDAYAKLSAELVKLKREAKNLGSELIALEKAGKKNTREYKAVAAQYIIAKNSAAALDKQLKSLDHSVGDNQRNVGNYKQSIKDAARELGLFGGTTEKILSVMNLWIQSLRTSKAATEENAIATKAAEAATGRWGRVLHGVKLTLKGLGIGALIALLGSIAASFKTTEKGIIQFEALINSIGSVIKVFVGRLGQFGSGLIDLFSGIGKDVGNAISNIKIQIMAFVSGQKAILLPTNNASQAIDKMKNAFTGMGAAIQKTIDLEFELAALRRQNRKDNLQDIAIIRKYASEVELLNQKSTDQTLSFREREEAAKKALELIAKSSEAEIRIKERAVKEAIKELEIRQEQNEDTLTAEEELAKALNELDDAKTKGQLSKLQIEENLRTTRIKQMQNEINLIEQTFDKEKELRDKQIEDLKKSFAERQKLINESDKLSKTKFEKEVAAITKASGVIIDANELITISNEEELSARIKSFELGDKAEDALLKAIINRKAEIKSVVDQNKNLNDKIIEDLKAQQQVLHEIANERIRTIEINLAQELKLAENNLSEQKKIILKLAKVKEDQLKADAANEIRKVKEDPITSAELKAKKILAIETELANDLLQLQFDTANQSTAIHKKQLEETFKVVNEITEGIRQGLEKRSEIQQEADQRDIDFHQRMIDVQSKLAAAGQENILAEELARADKAEAKKFEDQKRQAKLQETITIIKTFSDTLNQALSKNEPFLKAFAEASAASGLVSATFAKLFSGGFYEGTDSLDENKAVKIGEGKDNLLIRAHEGERILGVEDSAQLAGMTNKEVVEAGLMYKNDDFDNLYIPQFKAANVSTTQMNQQSHDSVMTRVLSRKIDELKQEIASKPVPQNNLGRLGEWTEIVQKKGLQTIIHHKKQSTRKSLRLNG